MEAGTTPCWQCSSINVQKSSASSFSDRAGTLPTPENSARADRTLEA